MTFSHKEDNSHFISLSDMMTGLMVIFLFISVAYMIKVKEQSDEILESPLPMAPASPISAFWPSMTLCPA